MRRKNVEVSLISDPGLKARFARDDRALSELAESMGNVGLLQPILVVEDEDEYRLVAGSRRLAAAKLLGWEKIPAQVYQKGDLDEARITIIENLQREDLSAVEEAVTFAQYMTDRNVTQEELAQLVGKTRSYIARSQMLLRLDDGMLEEVQLGNLSVAVALELGRIPDLETRDYYRTIAAEHGATVAVVRDWVRTLLSVPAEQDMPRIPDEALAPGYVPPQDWSPSCFICERKPPSAILNNVYVCQRCKQLIEQGE